MKVIKEKDGPDIWEKDADTMVGIFEKAEIFSQLKAKKDEIEASLVHCKAQIKIADKSLYDTMIKEDVPRFVRKGKMFHLKTMTHASAKKETKIEFLQVLKDNGYPELVVETVYAQTLSAFVRELLEESDFLPDWMKDYVSLDEKAGVGMRKAT